MGQNSLTELLNKHPSGQWQQKHHKFAHLTMKNNGFACFANAFFIFVHFPAVLVLSMM